MDDRMSRQEQNSHCDCVLFVLVNFALFVLLETGIAYRGRLKNWPVHWRRLRGRTLYCR